MFYMIPILTDLSKIVHKNSCDFEIHPKSDNLKIDFELHPMYLITMLSRYVRYTIDFDDLTKEGCAIFGYRPLSFVNINLNRHIFFSLVNEKYSEILTSKLTE